MIRERKYRTRLLRKVSDKLRGTSISFNGRANYPDAHKRFGNIASLKAFFVLTPDTVL